MSGKRKNAPAKTRPRPLLIELGTEELPPKALKSLGEVFAAGVHQGLVSAGLCPDNDEVHGFAAPRRLAVIVSTVAARQPDITELRRGPALAAAFDPSGEPTKAAQGFARSCGVEVNQLEKLETEKGAWLAYRKRQRGRSAATLVPQIIDEVLKALPIPRRMRWADVESEFVRPVHWLVLLHGTELIDATLLSVRSGRRTYGHRFHAPRPLTLRTASVYAETLRTRGCVIPDFAERRAHIRASVTRLAKRHKAQALVEDALLDEVTGLVEWPHAVHGTFDAQFLALPPEVLISVMRDQQRYFPLVNEKGRLLAGFITVANLKSRRPARVRAGNERVLRARFADAHFFWEADRKTTLALRVDALREIVFHHKLGTLHDRTQRIVRLAKRIATALGQDTQTAQRAALLSKADLVTGMVGEFPELQGTIGSYYAAHDGEPTEVAKALAEQYWPRHAGDELPRTPAGATLALADRLDMLTGIFGAGEAPTGDKDPLALRRAAVGVLRIVVERALPLDLLELLGAAANNGFPNGIGGAALVDQVFDFMMERLRALYTQAGTSPQVFEAVLACRPTRPLDFDRRVRAVTTFTALPEADALAAANKRIRNILRQAGTLPVRAEATVALPEPAERALTEALESAHAEVEPLLDIGDYTATLKHLAGLHEPVDRFFDEVMVMVEEPTLRNARLRLLDRLSALFLRVADVSKLQLKSV